MIIINNQLFTQEQRPLEYGKRLHQPFEDTPIEKETISTLVDGRALTSLWSTRSVLAVFRVMVHLQ